MKCKVAADTAGFYTERMSSRDTDDKSLYKHYSLLNAETTCGRLFFRKRYDTHGRVYSRRLLYLNLKVHNMRGDFFYGKSSNENHT